MQRARSSGAMPQDPAECVDTTRRGPRVAVPGAGRTSCIASSTEWQVSRASNF